VGASDHTDLAVLRVHLDHASPYLRLGDSRATPVGAWAIAIGSPYNLSHTVTVGVISAKARPLTIGDRRYQDLLQTSAAINPGNSGGPLLNLDGQVVGINTAVQSQGQGIGFAIPSETVTEMLPHLLARRRELNIY
jgi:S1-C subfamily serine protease